MLAFVVASFILPSVFGHCCFPEHLSAVAFQAGNPTVETMSVDFGANKSFIKPSVGDVDWVLNDKTTGKTYVMYKDTSCSIEPLSRPFFRCIPESATHFASGTVAGSNVESYRIVTSPTSWMTIGVTTDCLPFLLVNDKDGKIATTFYTNVTASVPDHSIFNMDISKCQ